MQNEGGGLGPGDDNTWSPKSQSGQENQQPGRTRGTEQEPTQQTNTKTRQQDGQEIDTNKK